MAAELTVVILCRDEAEAEAIIEELRMGDYDLIETQVEEV
jgi:hypothetical protein